MKNHFLKSLTLSFLLLTGCDTVAPTVDEQPHQVDNKPRPINTKDIWHHPEYVNIDADYDKTLSTPVLSLNINFVKPITSDVKHFQIYIDADNNAQTGYTGGGEHYIIKGADYMIEEGRLFRSTSSTAWKWTLLSHTPTYLELKAVDGSKSIKSTFDAAQILSDIPTVTNINVSIEPVNEQWLDTNNFVLTQAVSLLP